MYNEKEIGNAQPKKKGNYINICIEFALNINLKRKNAKF